MADFSSDVQTFTNNYLDYSKVSFEEVTYELGRILKLKSNNLQDFYRSSLGRRIAEIFASVLNVEWKYLEAQFKESFLTSAVNYSSIIAGANSLGYSIRRPTSAKTTIRMEVSGTVGSYTGKVTVPKFSTFQYSGINYVTLDDYTFNWDYNGNVTGPTNGANLIQGEFRIRRFLADEKKKFQKFSFTDTTFSNYYGEDDLLSDEESLTNRITCVTVDGEPFEIDKRTLYSSDTSTSPYVENGILVESRNKKCVVRTGNNGNIEILFGDGVISEIPRGVVEIRYLSSQGSSGNVFNTKDAKITFSGTEDLLFTPTTISKDNVTFYFENSPLGGDDIESIESVKYSAPKIYAALDRFVNKADYIAGLLTMDNVKYAIAYGEDDIAPSDYRYFNVVLYTVLKNIYVSDSSSTDLRIATPSEYIFSGLPTLEVIQSMQNRSGWSGDYLADQFDLSYLSNELDDQAKYNYYVTTYGTTFRLAKQNIEESSELDTIDKMLRKKGQLTCSHTYIPPKVHKFKMTATIYTTSVVSKSSLKSAVQQETYTYLKENSQFDWPIYNSKVVKLIEAKTGIVGCHVYFEPSDDIVNDSIYIDTLTSASYDIFVDYLYPTMANIASNYYSGSASLFTNFDGSYSAYLTYLKLFFGTVKTSNIYSLSNINEQNISNFIDKIYHETLGKLILNPYLTNIPSNLSGILSISDFNNPDTSENIYDTFVRWAVQFRKDTNYYSAKQLLTEKGDIANFTIPHEIAQVSIDVDDITVETKST